MPAAAYVIVSGTSEDSALIPLRYIYPECSELLKDLPKAENLLCFRAPCTRDKRCMNVLAHRVHTFFDRVLPEKVTHLFAYYKAPSGSIRAGVFTRDMDEPRVITCNQHAMKKLQEIGSVHTVTLDESFYNGSFIPVSSLLKRQ